MERREFIKLSIAALGSLLLGLESDINMPIQNYSQDYVVELLRKLYERTNTPIPQGEFDTLRRLVDEERTNAEKQRAWLRPQDERISSAFLDIPFGVLHSTVLETNKAELIVPISSNYKHLMIMGSFRTTSAGATTSEIWGQFNGDTGANNYAVQRLSGSVTTASAGFDNTTNKARIGVGAADGAGAGENGFFVAFIPHYTSNTFFKSTIALEGAFVNSITTGAAAIWTSQWYDTSPITSIRFLPDADSFKSGSLISVYGIQ